MPNSPPADLQGSLTQSLIYLVGFSPSLITLLRLFIGFLEISFASDLIVIGSDRYFYYIVIPL